MSTVTVSDIPLDAGSPAQRLRRTAAAVRVSLRWWGTHRSLTAQQKEEAGLTYGADARFLTAGKKLIDTRHEAVRRLTSVRTRLGNFWCGLTLPYTEPGVRLIRQSDIEAFVHTMEGFRDELAQAEADLNAAYAEIQADARRRLGRLYNPADYPPEVRGLFGVAWDFPSVEPRLPCLNAGRVRGPPGGAGDAGAGQLRQGPRPLGRRRCASRRRV